jgi:hypothetical protein
MRYLVQHSGGVWAMMIDTLQLCGLVLWGSMYVYLEGEWDIDGLILLCIKIKREVVEMR